jgi:hypothetical protein
MRIRRVRPDVLVSSPSSCPKAAAPGPVLATVAVRELDKNCKAQAEQTLRGVRWRTAECSLGWHTVSRLSPGVA